MSILKKILMVVRVFGGLGNQLFQYAFGQYLKNQSGLPINYDFEYFENNNFRLPNIKQFDFEILDSKKEASKKHIKFKSFRINNFYNKVFSANTFHCEPLKDNYIINSNDYYHGYWQNKRFSLSVIDSLKINFNIKTPSSTLQKYLEGIEKINNTVSIHIRRTDYLLKKNIAVFSTLDEDYFLKAMITMKELLKGSTLNFVVFSDDIMWAKNAFAQKSNISIIEGLEDYEDLYLMSHCNHHILSNSTFSWWGAVLNKQEDKKVICPKDWFNGDKKRMDALVLEEWILC